MDFQAPKAKLLNPLAALRKAGYSPFVDPKTRESSFVLRLTNGFYPRFHLYLKESSGDYIFSLHLDQTQASYGGTSAHKGEYDGPVVEKELTRLKGWVRAAMVDGLAK